MTTGLTLRFRMNSAPENVHPEKCVQELGISYAFASSHMAFDQWWFFDCRNVPIELPPFLEKIESQHQLVGVYA